MVTASAEMCYCGAGLEYIGPNKDTLHCVHCDEFCTVTGDPKNKEVCPNCSAANKFWKRTPGGEAM